MNSKDVAITVEGISKCYRIGSMDEMPDTFSGSVFNFIRSPLRNYRKYRSLYRFDDISLDPDSETDSNSSDIIWALRNVSFEAERGKALGIIGRNGAGKSTILKIFSKITHPTSGRVEIRGRVSSLLEVGTGFHNELTGRENVYLNGTILGMRKKEIDQKFDDIVDFSEVGRFVDTPVKRYSSGMRVRLAFAVAAHLEPEILIIDEVLAVGDAEFQAKCIGKMSSATKEGRTVLFVSHNIGAITELCSRVLWLDQGRLRLDGPPLDVVKTYLASGRHGVGFWERSVVEEVTGRRAWLRRARLLIDNENEVSTLFRFDEQVKIEIEYEIKDSVKAFRSFLLLKDALGNIVWASHDTDGPDRPPQVREPGIYHSVCIFPQHLLRPGQYSVSIGIAGNPREGVAEERLDVIYFWISGEGYTFDPTRKGVITPCLSWTVARQSLGDEYAYGRQG